MWYDNLWGMIMRVIAGKAKGHPLKSISTIKVRPTGDRVKEALFNILRPNLLDSLFLDLFAGFGGIGIEALSQGAKEVFFIEKHPLALKILKENLMKTSLLERAHPIRAELPQGLEGAKGKIFQTIFLDPPYQSDLILPVLKEIDALNLLSPQGLVVVEHEPSLSLDRVPFLLQDKRRYGREMLSFFTKI